jgi:hypothetical protein
MTITNALGSVVGNINYASGGKWINMDGYSPAVYFAATLGKSIVFVRY